ncbi:MAG: dephospho-CoA kinase [Acidimicrobiia bacterium]
MLIGLTGGIGSGKSTVAAALARCGAVVVDTDRIARDVVAPGTLGLQAVVHRFGDAVVDPDGALDRTVLAAIVFADANARRDLEAIVHPLVGDEVARQVGNAPAGSIIVVDVPLLVETDRRTYDAVVVVEAPLAQRLERLETRGTSRADAQGRIAAQATDEQRRAVADHVLINDGDLVHLNQQVEALWEHLCRRSGSTSPKE